MNWIEMTGPGSDNRSCVKNSNDLPDVQRKRGHGIALMRPDGKSIGECEDRRVR